MIETNTDDKGKLFERGGRKAFGTKLRDAEYVGRAAVLKLRGLPFCCLGRNMMSGRHRGLMGSEEDC